MKKGILPSKTYLVCSSGLKKAELQVISQMTVFNDNKNRKIATIDDRFGDFICKYALILGALVLGALIASGGSAVAMIATVLIATGISLSMCAIVNLFNSGGWKSYHPTVFINQNTKRNVLTEKSYFSCPIGGTIIPIYDEAIASKQAAIFRDKALTEILMAGVGGYALGGFVAASAGFGTIASGLTVGFGIGAGVSYVQDKSLELYYGEMSEKQKESPLYHKSEGTDVIPYATPKMTGDENTTKTIEKAGELRGNKEQIIDSKVQDRLNSNTGRNGGLLKNDPKKLAKIARDNGNLSNSEYLRIRRELQAKQVADLRATDGLKQYKSEHIKNLKESGSRFKEGFSLKNKMGRIFWISTVVETASNFWTEGRQRELYDESTAAEDAVKKHIGVFAQKV
ncbi:hypothetical protein [Mucilaginibacter glaciei]|uniref:DUF4280 domain-containing protein n=1 Tax=Mucilaginibacter glaciei TaxID=2772109 RepID=A0A926NN98_9SPHI|nr:hypothetical protein [Mucilaginibacter glaciei]MBD1391657.1 hypothetical protein [Mucilaginibacter glaciei]